MKTIIPDTSAPCPRDTENRQFRRSKFRASAPKRICPFSDAKSIICRVMDALEQVLYVCRPAHKGGLIHHSDKGLSVRYTERMAKAGIETSLGSVADTYDRASGRHWFKATGKCFG